MQENAAEIARLKARLRELEADLADYRSDYATLVDQETVIAQIITVCDNTDYLNQCLTASVDNISEVASSDKVPGFEELFDFSEVSGYQENLSIVNGRYLDDLKTSGDKIDSLKSEIAEIIYALTIEIENVRGSITYYGG